MIQKLATKEGAINSSPGHQPCDCNAKQAEEATL